MEKVAKCNTYEHTYDLQGFTLSLHGMVYIMTCHFFNVTQRCACERPKTSES